MASQCKVEQDEGFEPGKYILNNTLVIEVGTDKFGLYFAMGKDKISIREVTQSSEG